MIVLWKILSQYLPTSNDIISNQSKTHINAFDWVSIQLLHNPVCLVFNLLSVPWDIKHSKCFLNKN